MDRIAFAERRFRQIVPEPVRDWHGMPVRKLAVWLRDDVAGLVSEYIARPKFRDAACWSLNAFRPKADTAARRQVDAVADGLIRHAGMLRMLLRSKKVAAAVEALAPPIRHFDEVVKITGAGAKTTSRTTHEESRLPVLIRQIESLARPFWTDLVDPADYMGPWSGWLLRTPPVESVTHGVFVVALNPELHAIGDFVVRCLIRRVEILVRELEEADRIVLSCIRTFGGKPPKRILELEEDAARLREATRQLHAVCLSDPEAGIRDSCVILTQVYAAFHPVPDVGWLGLDDVVIAYGKATLKQRFANTRNAELPERVAAALGDLRRLYANEPPGQSALEEAVARGGLVLVTSPHTVYWKGTRLNVDWDRYARPWELLLELAKKVRFGAEVNHTHVFPDGPSASAMATLFSRLKKHLPSDLWKHAMPGETSGSYRLVLDPSQVTIFPRSA